MPPNRPSFVGDRSLRAVSLPQLPAALEAAAVVAAVMGFGLSWAWLAAPPSRDLTAEPVYPAAAMPADPSNIPTQPAGTAAAPEAETTEWLIDGFNLLHTVLLGGEERGQWWTAASRSRVLEAVAAATQERGHDRVWVVFDGSRPAPEPATGPLQSVFAPSADDWLVRRVKSASDPSRVVVITADRKLANRARHHGASVQTPRAFLTGEA